MGLLSEDEIGRIRIGRLIFHVVGPEDGDLLLMDEVDVTGFEEFFLDRIKETNIGNRFNFISADTGIRPALQSIVVDPDAFVATSKAIAEQFHLNHEAVAASRGAFIVAALIGGASPTFALIKCDDQRVLRFRQERTEAGGIKAVVSEVDNTFIEDRRAMQKSALVVLSNDGGDLAVFDRMNRRDIGLYFRKFLGVRAMWTPAQATERFRRALDSAFQVHQQDATKELRREWRRRLYDAVQEVEEVGPETLDQFGSSVFGPFWNNQPFRARVGVELDRQKVSDEVIPIDRTVIKKPPRRVVRTREGVVISYPNELDDAPGIVSYEARPDGGAVITITTRKIEDDQLVAEEPSTRRSRAV